MSLRSEKYAKRFNLFIELIQFGGFSKIKLYFASYNALENEVANSTKELAEATAFQIAEEDIYFDRVLDEDTRNV